MDLNDKKKDEKKGFGKVVGKKRERVIGPSRIEYNPQSGKVTIHRGAHYPALGIH